MIPLPAEIERQIAELESMKRQPVRADAVRWLLGRIPPEWLDCVHVGPSPLGFPELGWGWYFDGLSIEFVTPHCVRWCRWLNDDRSSGEFNLAMNLTEITDLIRSTLEPKP